MSRDDQEGGVSRDAGLACHPRGRTATARGTAVRWRAAAVGGTTPRVALIAEGSTSSTYDGITGAACCWCCGWCIGGGMEPIEAGCGTLGW